MILWRIATETLRYAAADLSGAGAAIHPGRWNEEGQAVLYTAPSIALAVLETAAHIDDAGLPLNRFLVQIDVPKAVWVTRKLVDPSTLPVTWSAIPAGRGSAKFGSEWIAAGRSPILLVPSVIVPEEMVTLVNPAHPLAKRMTATVVRAFDYNRLFRA
ncbi:MAG: RES family NAD+ phosphorylase [Rhodoferax sp.]|nr:RES family NAD+ phosphorylase [Rhodoferax sp.]